jgi:uncharacterized membrane-anchored protein
MDLDRRTSIKVPELTVYFWVIKVLSTGMGEATSDFFVHRVGLTNKPGLVGLVFVAGIALVASLVWQVSASRYVAGTYWLAVVMVSVFGTMAADGVHFVLGIPYLVSSVLLALVLTAIFVAWYVSEKTLSIHSIFTFRRELFYWAVVLATFAVGTAVGDMTAYTLRLGFFSSGLLFTGLMVVPAVAYRWLRLNGVVAFWFAYILTRPLGASFADWLAVSHGRGGLGLGYGPVSVGSTTLIVILVGYLAITRLDVAPSTVMEGVAAEVGTDVDLGT